MNRKIGLGSETRGGYSQFTYILQSANTEHPKSERESQNKWLLQNLCSVVFQQCQMQVNIEKRL